MALTRLQQLCVLEEATEATAQPAASLFSSTPPQAGYAAPAAWLPIEPSLEYEIETYERRVQQGSMTPMAPLTGARLGRVRFGIEATARSASVVGVMPSFSLPLRACGYRREFFRRYAIGAITNGPFRHGEIITHTPAGGPPVTWAAYVIGDTYDGMTHLFATRNNGLVPLDLATTAIPSTPFEVVGAQSGATCSVSAVSELNNGVAWWPFSYALSQLWFTSAGIVDAITAGDILRGVQSGALGVAYHAVPVTTPTQRAVLIRKLSGYFAAGEVIANDTLGDTNIGILGATPGHETQMTAPTLSIGLSKDGVREALYGCRGTFTLQANIGEPLIFNFDFRGAKHPNFPVDGPNVAGVSIIDRIPPTLLGVATRFGYTGMAHAAESMPCLSSFTLDGGNQVEFRRCLSATAGVAEAQVVARNMTGTIDPELGPEGVYPLMTKFLANDVQRLRLTYGVAPDKFQIQLHNVAVTSAATTDRNGTAVRTANFQLNSGSTTVGSGDNEMVFLWHFSEAMTV